MYCKTCGKILNQGELFCTNCGTKVENEKNINLENNGIQNNQTETFSNINTLNNNINQNEENGSTFNNQNEEIGQTFNNQNQEIGQTFNNQIQPNDINLVSTTNQNFSSNFNNQQIAQTNIQYQNNTNNKGSKALVSLILGIVSIVLSFILNIFIIPVAIVGLVLGLIEKNKSGKKTAGIVLNAIAIVLPVIILILGSLSLVDDFTGNNIFYGDGYQLTYDNDWVSGTVFEKKALSYSGTDNSYFLPIGKSAMSKYPCNFEDSTCQSQLYNDFYDLWSESLNTNSLYLYKDSYSFNILKDDIYYGTYNYGKSSTDLRGKYYLLVSKEKNVVLSFMTNCNADDVDVISEEVLELFKTIEIEINTSANNSNSNSNSDENVIYDDELHEMLDSTSNWNRYSSLRTGNLGKVLSITGGWRILSDYETYWEFKNGEFYWYKSVNDLNDNYWQGTTKILTGKEGLKSVGLDGSKVDNIVSRSNGSVTANDIYAIVCTPTKIISGGEDKSATNIHADSKWNYVWVVVNHGTEGIEAQVINVDTAETTYYVKVKD